MMTCTSLRSGSTSTRVSRSAQIPAHASNAAARSTATGFAIEPWMMRTISPRSPRVTFLARCCSGHVMVLVRLPGRALETLEPRAQARLGVEKEDRGGDHLFSGGESFQNGYAALPLHSRLHFPRTEAAVAERYHDMIAASAADHRFAR